MNTNVIKVKPNEKGEYWIILYGTKYRLEIEPIEKKPKESK